jgi:glutamine amidotransferase
MVVIVDYGLGNLGSISNMLKKIGADSTVTASASEIERAGLLVLPGVGAFDQGMANLRNRGLVDPLNRSVLERRVPILGICLGMQLFCDGSDEGQLPGLGWIPGRGVRFGWPPTEGALKVPHMGWNEVAFELACPLAAGLQEQARFYFVHSYHVVCRDVADVAARATYGFAFTAAVQHGNILGVQFHPEKSHRYGMQLLRNFCALAPR